MSEGFTFSGVEPGERQACFPGSWLNSRNEILSDISWIHVFRIDYYKYNTFIKPISKGFGRDSLFINLHLEK